MFLTKQIIVALMLCALVTADTLSHIKIQNQQQFQSGSKTYRDIIRANNHAKSLRWGAKYNYTSGSKKFLHLTSQEFKNTYLGYKGTSAAPTVSAPSTYSSQLTLSFSTKNAGASSKTTATASTAPSRLPVTNQSLPILLNINWTNILATNVKNQGACGSCWAFAGVAEIQSFFLWKYSLWLDLSEQQAVDCSILVDSDNSGCGGGYSHDAASYAMVYPFTTERYYPYQAATNPCNSNRANQGKYKIQGYYQISGCTNIAIQLLQRPMIVCASIDDQWQAYNGGVIQSCNQGSTSGHCVEMVGVVNDGTTNTATNFWIVKNSWGTDWGELGYMRIYWTPADQTGICGICGGVVSF